MSELGRLGLVGARGADRVGIFVGANGSGKSNLLRQLAVEERHKRNVLVVCNTAYDRFTGLREIQRLSAGRSGQSPKTIVKEGFARALRASDSRMFDIEAILDYCGFAPRIGFQLVGNRLFGGGPYPPPPTPSTDWDQAMEFLQRSPSSQMIWSSEVEDRTRNPSFERSRIMDFASVLLNEKGLRKVGVLREINVYLEHKAGFPILLSNASSGELALISSLIFLIAQQDRAPLILIDEPENSLHPQWQREYVEKILAATTYREATIIIATHAPLIVTGALATNHRDRISVFQVDQQIARPLDVNDGGKSTTSIEEILWRAFDVLTPANHFISEQIAEAVAKVERGEIKIEEAEALVEALQEHSFEPKQQGFLRAVRELLRNTNASSFVAGDEDD